MDSLTHIALGACLGEAFIGKKLGKKALFWGAVAQSLPDIDSVPALWVTPDKALLIHRGLTHSFFFAIFAGLALALIIKWVDKTIKLPFIALGLFCSLQFIVHDLLDTCNSYGTGLLEPFSNHRFSINLLYVADPAFSIALVAGFLWLAIKNRESRYRKVCAYGAISVSMCYLGFSVYFKEKTDRKVEAGFKSRHISLKPYFSTPAPFTNLLWYVVIKDGKGYYTAYSSVLDTAGLPIRFEWHNANDFLLAGHSNSRELRHLKDFANAYYVVTRTQNTVYFNIMRFGQVQGWQAPGGTFVLSYPLGATHAEASVLQKGRVAGWNKQSFVNYLKRINGEQVNGQPEK